MITDEIKIPLNFGLAIEEVFEDDPVANDPKCVKIEEVFSDNEEEFIANNFEEKAKKRKSSWRKIPIQIEEIDGKSSFLKRWNLKPSIRSFQMINITCS